MENQHLRKFFHFTEVDLTANSRGQFSEGQTKRLLTDAKKEQASARSSAVILFVIAAAGMAIGLTITAIAPSGIGRILILLFMGILWTFVWAGKGIQALRSASSLSEPKLGQVSGRIHIVKHTSEDYVLQIGDMEFDLEKNPSGVMMEGDEYKLYYVEATEEILSVESLIREQ